MSRSKSDRIITECGTVRYLERYDTGTFAIYRAKSDLPEKRIFTNISDQTKNNEMKVVGGWEFELVKAIIGKDC